MRKSFYILLASVILTSSFLIIKTYNPNLPPQPSETEKLQTFSSDQYQFEFKYPSSWKFAGRQFTTSLGNQFMFIIYQDSSSTITEFLAKEDKISSTAWEGGPSKSITSTKKSIINGHNYIQRQEYLTAADITSIVTYFKVNNGFVQFSLIPPPGNIFANDLVDYQQLLSTVSIGNTPTSFWKTYKNATEGYQIKYPETFQLEPCDEGDCFGDYLKSFDYLGMAKNEGDFTIVISYSDKLNPNQTFDEWFKSKMSKDFRSTLIIKQKKFSINNYLVHMFNYQPIDPGSNIDDYYYITNDNLIFQLRVYGIFTTSTQLQIDQILSTFKFVQ